MSQRVEVTVEYTDGTSETTVLRPAALVAAERKWGGKVPPIEGTLFAAWHQLRPGPAFDAWLERVDGVEERVADPSSATPSAPSPASPSPQD